MKGWVFSAGTKGLNSDLFDSCDYYDWRRKSKANKDDDRQKNECRLRSAHYFGEPTQQSMISVAINFPATSKRGIRIRIIDDLYIIFGISCPVF